jgi:hypothetical protein
MEKKLITKALTNENYLKKMLINKAAVTLFFISTTLFYLSCKYAPVEGTYQTITGEKIPAYFEGNIWINRAVLPPGTDPDSLFDADWKITIDRADTIIHGFYFVSKYNDTTEIRGIRVDSTTDFVTYRCEPESFIDSTRAQIIISSLWDKLNYNHSFYPYNASFWGCTARRKK